MNFSAIHYETSKQGKPKLNGRRQLRISLSPLLFYRVSFIQNLIGKTCKEGIWFLMRFRLRSENNVTLAVFN